MPLKKPGLALVIGAVNKKKEGDSEMPPDSSEDVSGSSSLPELLKRFDAAMHTRDYEAAAHALCAFVDEHQSSDSDDGEDEEY